jgi:PAS domain-containing protein
MDSLHLLTVRTAAALSRLAELERRAQSIAAPSGPVVRPALKELTAALEELKVANEQLQLQTEELAFARHRDQDLQLQWEEFANVLPVACVWTDAAGVIVDANDAAAELLNVARGRLAGKPLILFVGNRERFFDALGTLRAAEAPVLNLELLVRPRERRPRASAVTARRLQHDDRWCWFFVQKAAAASEIETSVA